MRISYSVMYRMLWCKNDILEKLVDLLIKKEYVSQRNICWMYTNVGGNRAQPLWEGSYPAWFYRTCHKTCHCYSDPAGCNFMGG